MFANMNKRRIFILISVLLAVFLVWGFFYFFNQQPLFPPKNKKEKSVNGANSVLLKQIPIVKQEDPLNPLLKTIIGYEDKLIAKGETFVLEPVDRESEESLNKQVGRISLKLEDVKVNSIMLEVLGYEAFDGKIYPRTELIDLHPSLEQMRSLNLEKEVQSKIFTTQSGWSDQDYFFRAEDKTELETQLKEIPSLTEEEENKIIRLWEDVLKETLEKLEAAIV